MTSQAQSGRPPLAVKASNTPTMRMPTTPHPTLSREPGHRPGAAAAFPLLAAVIALAGLLPAAAAQTVKLDTSMGAIVLELDREKAPKTVDNFLAYVRAGHYDGTVFHRVIESFMIQGGGFTAAMQQKPTRPPIPLESRNGLSNLRGTVAMARTMDPNSASAQFFVNVRDNPFLDQPRARDGHGYAVFGRVTAGMDVVDRIRAVPTGQRGPHGDVPLEPVVIKKATVEN